MLTPTTRWQHGREGLRYETDLSDEDWRVIEPHLSPPEPLGRARDWTWREIINGILYVLRGWIAWRLMPREFPPWQTVYRWFAAWRDSGLFEKINHPLVLADRERVGREASPSAAIIDSQSLKTTEADGSRGYDAGKKINGRKRHALVDTDGRGLIIEPHAASIQDRDGSGPSLSQSCGRIPISSASPSIRAVGWWNASSPGSAATVGWQRILKQPSTRQEPSFMPPRSCFLSAASAELHDFRNSKLTR